MFDRALKEYGRLDITYNNAGIGGATGRLGDITADDWDKTFVILTPRSLSGYQVFDRADAQGGWGFNHFDRSVGGSGPRPDFMPIVRPKPRW